MHHYQRRIIPTVKGSKHSKQYQQHASSAASKKTSKVSLKIWEIIKGCEVMENYKTLITRELIAKTAESA